MNGDTNGTQTVVEMPAQQENPFAQRAAAATEAAKPRKASLLSQITTRKRRRPIFAVLYGPPGIGKSTFAANAPKPVFIPAERGLDQITTSKFPTPKTFKELWDIVLTLDQEEHEFETIVIDTLDAVEVLIWARVCAEGKVTSIEDYGGGYGKGYVRAREIWTGLLNKLSEMNEKYNVLLLAHSHLKTITDPTLSAAYDQYKIKVHDKSADIIRQMVDLILFANLDVTVAKETPKARKGRGIISGDRQLWTQPATGIEAKNRFNLESPISFEWEALATGIEKFYQS
jgi:hypothetical protein